MELFDETLLESSFFSQKISKPSSPATNGFSRRIFWETRNWDKIELFITLSFAFESEQHLNKSNSGSRPGNRQSYLEKICKHTLSKSQMSWQTIVWKSNFDRSLEDRKSLWGRFFLTVCLSRLVSVGCSATFLFGYFLMTNWFLFYSTLSGYLYFCVCEWVQIDFLRCLSGVGAARRLQIGPESRARHKGKKFKWEFHFRVEIATKSNLQETLEKSWKRDHWKWDVMWNLFTFSRATVQNGHHWGRHWKTIHNFGEEDELDHRIARFSINVNMMNGKNKVDQPFLFHSFKSVIFSQTVHTVIGKTCKLYLSKINSLKIIKL